MAAEKGSILNLLYEEKMYKGKDKNGQPLINGVYSYEEGFDRLFSSKSLETYQTSYESVMAKTVGKYECAFVAPWISKYPGFLSMAVPKGSPYW